MLLASLGNKKVRALGEIEDSCSQSSSGSCWSCSQDKKCSGFRVIRYSQACRVPDVTDVSEDERNTGDVADDEVADKDQKAKESKNTSAVSDLRKEGYPQASFGKGVDNDVSEEEPSGKSGGKVTGGDVNFDEVDSFLNDDVQVSVENVEIGGSDAVASFLEVMVIGVPVSSLTETLDKFHDIIFGLRLENDKGILRQFIKVSELD